MPWDEHLLAEFGRRLGLGELRPPASGPLTLEVGGLGQLALEPLADGDLLLSLALPLPPYERERLTRALRRCAPEQGPVYPLACGCHHNHLIFMVRLPQAGLRAADLENAAVFLLETARAAA
ncbi:MAG: CesT family type III secretion system chaperone [Candidatus Adiutrix sp.]|jgi:type III secretion system chaperone SycN|nr:CesT family type III secretion system chaperone [Candidatus Adiutrix sp.]